MQHGRTGALAAAIVRHMLTFLRLAATQYIPALGARPAHAHNASCCFESLIAPMSSIDIRHDHSLTPAQARAAIDETARKLTDRYGIASHWEGDTLRIAHAGVDGEIALLPRHVHVTAEIGFLLSPMQPMMESEIRRLLAEKLA